MAISTTDVITNVVAGRETIQNAELLISNLSKVKEYYNSASNTNSNLEDGVECSGFLYQF